MMICFRSVYARIGTTFAAVGPAVSRGAARDGVLGDIPAVGPFDHRDAGIVVDRDAHRHAGE